MTTEMNLWLLGGLVVLCLALGYFVRLVVAKRIGATLEQKIKAELESARNEAKEIIIAGKDKAASILVEAQKEERERKQELRHLEERLVKKEDLLERERSNVNAESERLKKEFQKSENLETDAKAFREKAVKEMERVAGLSREEAKNTLFRELEQEYKEDLKESIVKLEKNRRDQVEAKALEIITSTIQRYARDHVVDVTTTVVELPNEEIKGKIIGREGRNIRAFERLTGVEVIVDEMPESILLSSFDPMRRELAKIALEKLIKDGRIQPAKIEEKIEEARLELDSRVRKIGEEAAYEVGILDLPKEITFLLGRLNYRTSYGQNVLQHSIEMTHISAMIAAELHLNIAITKKAALLHDIGKAIDHEVEGTHVDLGRKILKKYNIDDAVIQAMEAHHEEYPFSSSESYVVAAADAISAARPGARRDSLEKYLKRLEEIEKVVHSFEGVKQAYAVSAGREVRVFVVPEKIDDFGALQLAKKVAGKIQSDIQYPGEIKVTVIREIKAVEFAR
ncbi:MAG: ribonuclease Y [Patescibacteria group bacterium]|nr:ribonuclease Y [Patescibacteria group bacterium]